MTRTWRMCRMMTSNISRAWAATWKRGIQWITRRRRHFPSKPCLRGPSLYMRPRTPEGLWAEVGTDQCMPTNSWRHPDHCLCRVNGLRRETADPPRQNLGNPERHHKDHRHHHQQVNADPHQPRLKFPRQSLYRIRPIGNLRKRNTTILLGEQNPSRRPLRPSKVWCLPEQRAPNPKRHMHSPQEVSVAQRAQRQHNPSMPSQKHQCPGMYIRPSTRNKLSYPTLPELNISNRPAPAKSEAPPKSTKTEPPKSRAPSRVAAATINDNPGFIAPIPIPAPPLGPSHIPSPPRSSSANNPRPIKEIREVREVREIKTLPAPPNDLFCRYASDLQNSHLPLHPNFKSSGSHRCPTCSHTIPVDTRDVWVLSTHSPSNNNNNHHSSRTKDYRLDARFITKCHTPQRGEFACVLCDRFRDRDCLCRGVDSLVAHLGKEHCAEEFERDDDLIRMDVDERGGNGGGRMVVRGKAGREMALA